MNNIILTLEKINEKGILKTIKILFLKCYFYFYKYTFKKCKSIFIYGEMQITGKKHIEIESFSAGSRIRIDAITRYLDKKYYPLIKIGKNFVANNDIHIGCTNKVIIGDNVLLGSNIYITDHDHGIYDINTLNNSNPIERPIDRVLTNNGHVIINDNVFIGEYVVILKNVEIGIGSIIGSNSVVNKNIPPYSIAVGNPVKIVKKFDFEDKQWKKIK
jgi:acetyltransferase-like isoleucine patch superfamily enzyme